MAGTKSNICVSLLNGKGCILCFVFVFVFMYLINSALVCPRSAVPAYLLSFSSRREECYILVLLLL